MHNCNTGVATVIITLGAKNKKTVFNSQGPRHKARTARKTLQGNTVKAVLIEKIMYNAM